MIDREINNSGFGTGSMALLNSRADFSPPIDDGAAGPALRMLIRKDIMMKALTNPNQSNSKFAQILVCTAMFILMLGRAACAEDLFVSDTKDISNLGLANLYIQESPSLSEFMIADKQQPLRPQNIRMATLTCSIDVADCTLSRRTDGCDDLEVEGLPCIGGPGRPRLPVKTITLKLPGDAQVLGIEIEAGSYREILNPVNPAISSRPRIWMRQEDIPEQINKKWEMASVAAATVEPHSHFPGEIATYDSGKDNDTTYVNIRAFPVQYIAQSDKAILITDATINVYYSLPAPRAKAFTMPRSPDPAESVILCPSPLKQAAELLRDFHEQQENVSTSIITTEQIDSEYSPADDPPYTGYSAEHAGRDKIAGYKYDLARKIISYLRDQEQHPNLKYVVLFGDAQLVPPSYYINEWAASEWYTWSSYEDWIPTDFLYTSPDYDFVPNYRVGRLPVSDVDQAVSVIRKIERWHESLSWDWFKRASVAGGRPFGTMWYYGELGTVDLINRNFFNGMEVSKYFYTDGTLDVAHVKPLFTTASTGLLYHIDHGSGHKLWLEDESIGADDIMISSSARYPLFNPKAPVVVSVSCMNGAYDTDLTNFEEQPEFPEIPDPTSFGESVVLSNAGGIAYIGGTRLNYADWSTFYDEGRLLAHHYFMAQICSLVFESYHKGARRIGDMTYDAQKYYAQDNNMDYRANRETIFGFVLLGDPVLSVPTEQPGLSCRKPHLIAVEPDRISGEGIPGYKDLPSDRSRPICIISDSDSPTTEVKSIYVWSDTLVGTSSLDIASPTHTFTPKGCGCYLVRSSAIDGKEGWLYLNAQYEFTPTSNVLLIDGDYGDEYERYYTGTLDRLGLTYDIWEAGARDPVDAQTLAQYVDGAVIWTIPFSCPNGQEKRAFESYLDNGGRLFITGQDIGRCLTNGGFETDDFYQNYLHAQYVRGNAQIDTLSGTPGDPISNALAVNIRGGDGARNQYYPDVIEAISPAATIFTYEPACEAALRVDTGAYKVVYFGFGFEGVNSQADRDNVMERVLDWLLECSPRGR
jgi:hypothetical protein